MDLNQVTLPRLKGIRKATILSAKKKENENGGYLDIVFKLSDREQPYKIFNGKGDKKGNQLRYVIQGLKEQLGSETNELTDMETLNLAKKKEFEIEFTYDKAYNSLNISFPDKEEELDI